MPSKVRQYEAFEHAQKIIQTYKSTMALVTELKSDSIKDRHWLELSRKLRLRVSFSELSIGQIWDAGMPNREAGERQAAW